MCCDVQLDGYAFRANKGEEMSKFVYILYMAGAICFFVGSLISYWRIK